MSARARVIGIVALLAVAAAGTAVGGAILQDRAGRVGGEVHGRTATTTQRRGPPALELAIIDRDDREARALREAERLYETDRKEQARRRFRDLLVHDPGSVEAAVGAAISSWPEGTVERLEELIAQNPDSAVVRLNLGLALVAEGDVRRAREEWQEAEEREPDSPAALRAEDLRNPDMPPGRPRFILADDPIRGLARLELDERLRALERRAAAGGSRAWLRYGSALEAVGHRVSARGAYDRALALAPKSLEARVAAAVARFDKDDPSAAFSRLGPLSAQYPRAPIVRFHLGMMLLWLPNVEEARRQLGLASSAAPADFYGRQARRVLDRLGSAE